MPDFTEKGYIDPLLTGIANDYSVKAREGLIAELILPTVKVSKPSGYFFTYTKEQAYKYSDDTMSEDGEAKEIKRHGTKTPYYCQPRGNKTFVSKDEEVFKEGPFVRADIDFVKDIILNIERNREVRTRDRILNLPGRSVALSGNGSGKANKWTNGSGDPFLAIQDAIKELFYRPNKMIISESVFDVLEFHPKLLEKLGEANMVKKVNEETLSKLFRVDKVIIAGGKGDSSKFNKDSTVNPTLFWGNNVILAYVDDRKDAPCVGHTFVVALPEADNKGYVVRKYDDNTRGVLGGHIVQVGCYMDEMIVCPDLVYSIKDCI